MTIETYLREADKLIKEGSAIYNLFKTEMTTAGEGKKELVPKLQAMAECFKNRSNSVIKRLKSKMTLVTTLDDAETKWYEPVTTIEEAVNNIRSNASNG